jgi:hypothetical protein
MNTQFTEAKAADCGGVFTERALVRPHGRFTLVIFISRLRNRKASGGSVNFLLP